MTLNPQLITADRIAQPYDAVLLTVKGFQLKAALADLAKAIGPETVVMPVLNGMRHMDILAGRFNEHNLIGCALKIATVIEEDGRIVQLTPLRDLAYGELDGRMTPSIQALNAFMGAPASTPASQTRSVAKCGENGFFWLRWARSLA